MNTFGYGHHGTTILDLDTDDKVVTADLALTFPVQVPKVSAFVDGLGGGDQVARAVIHGSGGSGVVVAESAEILIPGNQPGAWIDFPFAEPGGIALSVDEGEEYRLALHAGDGDGLRITEAQASGGTLYTDTYSNGANTLSGGTSAVIMPAIYATYFTPWETPVAADLDLGRLGFPSAQEALSAGLGALDTYSATCGWHGYAFHPERGSFAIVKDTGPLVSLLGERVRITYGDEVVVAYVIDSGDTVEQVTVTRRLYMELTAAATDEIDVTVEVLG